nr:phosphotransferase [Roseibium limicola]
MPLRQHLGPLLSAQRLAGLTNLVFWISSENGEFVLRLPRQEAAGIIDRHAECANLQAAADLGVTPRPLYCDPTTGRLLLPAIQTQGDATAEALGGLLAALHASSVSFAFERDLFSYLRERAAALSGAEELQALSAPLCGQVEALLAELDTCPLVPSHFDPSPGNVLVSGDDLYLIDFEYAAMAPAGWDLAYAVLEHEMSRQEEMQFLQAYAVRAPLPPIEEVERYKVVCDTVSMLWALGQHKAGSDADDFLAFAEARRDRAQSRLKQLPVS